MANINEICPPYVGDARVRLSLYSTPEFVEIPRAEQTVDIAVDYSGTGDSGPMLPLDLVIAGPTEGASQFRTFEKFAPELVVFVPTEPGKYTVTLTERHHNQWRGTLEIDVQ
jgi:hypothetical protein